MSEDAWLVCLHFLKKRQFKLTLVFSNIPKADCYICIEKLASLWLRSSMMRWFSILCFHSYPVSITNRERTEARQHEARQHTPKMMPTTIDLMRSWLSLRQRWWSEKMIDIMLQWKHMYQYHILTFYSRPLFYSRSIFLHHFTRWNRGVGIECTRCCE